MHGIDGGTDMKNLYCITYQLDYMYFGKYVEGQKFYFAKNEAEAIKAHEAELIRSGVGLREGTIKKIEYTEV